MEKEQHTAEYTHSDEIDLIELFRYYWDSRRLILTITGTFFLLGLLIAFLSTKEYKSEARMLPEIRDISGGASSLLRQFGGLGGLSLPVAEGADAIGPNLYPDVLRSTPFFLELMNQEISFKNQGEYQFMNVFSYVKDDMENAVIDVIKRYTIQLPWTILGLFRTDENGLIPPDKNLMGISKLSREQYEVIKVLRNRINATAHIRTGLISVTAEFPDPFVAAQIADFAVKYLTDYITGYRIEKVRKDLEFVKERHAEKEREFYKAQLALARFRDANINIISAAARTEEQRLQDQYNLAFNVYNGLAQQLEQARIKVQEETPVIKILEPVQVPVIKSKPRRVQILIISIILGFLFGITIVFVKKNFGGKYFF